MEDPRIAETNERKFLHDLGSPLGTAIFIAEALLDDLQVRAGTNPDDLMQLKELYSALDRVRKIIEARREVLIHQSVPRSKAGT